MTANEIIDLLGLQPLQPEGGYFAEVYRSAETIAADALPARYGASRSIGTAIYYLLRAGEVSRMHRLQSDEVYHFYLGDPVQILFLPEGGAPQTSILGPDLAAGQRPQLTVPRGTWQGARLLDGGAWALLGTTVAPGFEFDDFEVGERTSLLDAWPDAREEIENLTD